MSFDKSERLIFIANEWQEEILNRLLTLPFCHHPLFHTHLRFSQTISIKYDSKRRQKKKQFSHCLSVNENNGIGMWNKKEKVLLEMNQIKRKLHFIVIMLAYSIPLSLGFLFCLLRENDTRSDH